MTKAPPTLAEILSNIGDLEHERVHTIAPLAVAAHTTGDQSALRRYDETCASRNEERCADLDQLRQVAQTALAAIDAMAEAIGDVYTATDTGRRFTCREADSIAAVMLHGSLPEAAFRWLRGHKEGDDCGDAHHHLRALDYLHRLQTEARGVSR